MLSRIEVRNPQGSLLSLLMEDTNAGYSIQDFGGIGPVKATIVSSSFAQLDGVQFHSTRREARNLTLRLGLEPVYGGYSVGQLRQNLYDFFMTEMPVNLRCVMDADEAGLEVDIYGVVESCEPAIFDKTPVVDVSIMCANPDFFNRVPVTLSGSSTAGTTETLISYLGTVETGIKFALNVDRSLAEFAIYLKLPSTELQILEFNTPLVSGDVLNINTIKKEKSVTLTRLGVTSPILYGVTPQSSWVELRKGSNYIRVYATGAAVPYTLEYTTKYGAL
jgi:hypothetical protein